MQGISFRNLLLYCLLLIFTPFILLQNYFQWAISYASKAQLDFKTFSIPYILIIAFIFFLIVISLSYKRLNRKKIAAIVIIIFLWLLGQNSTDYYFGHKFYELQHNWHYIAYGIFAIIMYRHLINLKKSSSQIIRITLTVAILLSVFDELIQIPLSDRIFDICDIAKDTWGAILGLYFVFYVIEDGEIVKDSWSIFRTSWRTYFIAPFPLLIFSTFFSYFFLSISSILTESKYLGWIILFTISLFMIIFLVIHQLQYKKARIAILILAGIVLILQLVFFFTNINKDVIYHKNGITVYKGIPLIYFDLMINPNGTFRFVDKKLNFNIRDKHTIMKKEADIIVFGTGKKQRLNIGVSEEKTSHFIYNIWSKKVIQFIILDSKMACEKFNKLKKSGQNVLLILHNE